MSQSENEKTILVNRRLFDEYQELKNLVNAFMQLHTKSIFLRADSAELFSMIKAQLECINLEEMIGKQNE